MAFISKAVGGIAQSLGLMQGSMQPAALAPDATAPNAANSSDAMDAAALAQARAMQRGRTSTMLTGGAGVMTDPQNTSKILLGQ